MDTIVKPSSKGRRRIMTAEKPHSYRRRRTERTASTFVLIKFHLSTRKTRQLCCLQKRRMEERHTVCRLPMVGAVAVLHGTTVGCWHGGEVDGFHALHGPERGRAWEWGWGRTWRCGRLDDVVPVDVVAKQLQRPLEDASPSGGRGRSTGRSCSPRRCRRCRRPSGLSVVHRGRCYRCCAGRKSSGPTICRAGRSRACRCG